MYIATNGYHTVEFLTEVMQWIKDYPKDNDPTFKITESGVTVRFSGGHTKRVSFKRIMESQNKCLKCIYYQSRCGINEEFDCKTNNYRWYKRK